MNKEERRAYDREYHANRSPEKKARKQRLQTERLQRNLLEVRSIKESTGCMDCGESNPIVLEFDHRDRAEKDFAMGEVTRLGWSMDKIKEEILKCDVVCANCHRIRTSKQMGWYL